MRSEDLHKAGSLELQGSETSGMFDMLSKWKQELAGFPICYDRGFKPRRIYENKRKEQK